MTFAKWIVAPMAVVFAVAYAIKSMSEDRSAGLSATQVPAEAGTRLGSLGVDSVLYTKTQADFVFAPFSAIPTKVSQLANDAGYVTGAIELDGLWDAISNRYTKAEVALLVARAIYAASGPFAIVEDEHGNPAVVRRTEEEIERLVRELAAAYLPGGYPGNAYVDVDGDAAAVHAMGAGAFVATNYPGNAYIYMEGETGVIYRLDTNERVGAFTPAIQE